MTTAQLVIAVVASSLGTGYFLFGKRRQRWIAMGAGLGLMVAPIFIDSIPGALAACGVLAALPWFVRE